MSSILYINNNGRFNRDTYILNEIYLSKRILLFQQNNHATDGGQFSETSAEGLEYLWLSGDRYPVESGIGEEEKRGHLPTLPIPRGNSTIGLEELNGRVRNGNGCDLLSMSTPKIKTI